VDPLAEKLPNWTPYRYGLDNPLKYTDINGYIEWPVKGNQAVNKSDYSNGAWGLNNTVVRTSTYGEVRNIGTSPHIGIDYRASKGTSFYSLGDGTVNEIGTTSKGIKYVSVKYSNGDVVRFMHMNSFAEGLEQGQKVYEGQILGETGSSGWYYSNGEKKNYLPHLHIDAKDAEGNPLDPENMNYGTVTNEEFFTTYGGDYEKLRAAKEGWKPEPFKPKPQNVEKRDATRYTNPYAMISYWLQQNPNIKLTVQ
jgi:murein DD-endopeptidase MepM/ murein hydrolase activator NlpD